MMGREEGSGIYFKQVWNPSNNTYNTSWYCQQHNKYDQSNSDTLATSFFSLKTHIETQHGNVEQ